MSYQKILVDNVSCSRRFHLTFDNESKELANVSVKCPHCQLTIWSSENHPKVTLARDENMVKTTQLSRNLVKECDFKDPFKGPK